MELTGQERHQSTTGSRAQIWKRTAPSSRLRVPSRAGTFAHVAPTKVAALCHRAGVTTEDSTQLGHVGRYRLSFAASGLPTSVETMVLGRDRPEMATLRDTHDTPYPAEHLSQVVDAPLLMTPYNLRAVIDTDMTINRYQKLGALCIHAVAQEHPPRICGCRGPFRIGLQAEGTALVSSSRLQSEPAPGRQGAVRKGFPEPNRERSPPPKRPTKAEHTPPQVGTAIREAAVACARFPGVHGRSCWFSRTGTPRQPAKLGPPADPTWPLAAQLRFGPELPIAVPCSRQPPRADMCGHAWDRADRFCNLSPTGFVAST